MNESGNTCKSYSAACILGLFSKYQWKTWSSEWIQCFPPGIDEQWMSHSSNHLISYPTILLEHYRKQHQRSQQRHFSQQAMIHQNELFSNTFFFNDSITGDNSSKVMGVSLTRRFMKPASFPKPQPPEELLASSSCLSISDSVYELEMKFNSNFHLSSNTLI